MLDSNTLWESLEQRRSTLFLVAGVLLLVPAIGSGVEWITDMSLQGPLLGIPAFLGVILVYAGLLGIYPQLRDHAPRFALAGIVLILVPVVTIVLLLIYAVGIGGEPPFADAIFLVIGAGFALGIALFGLGSVQTAVPSKGVGVALLIFAIPWALIVVLGGENAVSVDFVIAALQAVSVLAIGYLLRAETTLTTSQKPTSDSTV